MESGRNIRCGIGRSFSTQKVQIEKRDFDELKKTDLSDVQNVSISASYFCSCMRTFSLRYLVLMALTSKACENVSTTIFASPSIHWMSEKNWVMFSKCLVLRLCAMIEWGTVVNGLWSVKIVIHDCQENVQNFFSLA